MNKRYSLFWKMTQSNTLTFYCFLLFCFLATTGTAQVGAQHLFTYKSEKVTALIDMDNDGDLDVLTYRGPDRWPEACLLWYENNNTEIWSPHCIDLPEEVGLENWNAADLTGDGWVDLFNDEVTLIHNGDPNNIDFTAIDNGIENSQNIIVGDINGDDLLDAVVVRGHSLLPLRSFLNINEDGTFEAVEFDEGIVEQNYINYDAQFVDMDQDNDLDIVMIIIYQTEIEDWNNLRILWYENTDNSNNFEISHTIYEIDSPIFFHGDYFLESGDFNGDGIIDILYSTEEEITLFAQQPDSTWIDEEIDNFTRGGDLEAGDFDNDGDLDFIEGIGLPNGNLGWFQNINNEGTFDKISFVDSLNSLSYKTYLSGDIDNDGDIDLCFYNSTGTFGFNGIFWFENEINTQGNFSEVKRISENLNGRHKPTIVDLDNDQDKDILFHSEHEKHYYWIEHFSSLDSFSTPKQLIIDELIDANQVIDLDGDGNLDVVGISKNNELVWYQNDNINTPAFGSQQVIQTGIYSKYLVADDIDGDGDVDFAVTSHPAAHNLIWLEQDNGSFISHLVHDDIDSKFEPLDFADLNNDGLLDILGKNITNNALQETFGYFKQETNNTFTYVSLLNLNISDQVVVDIDDDQDDDVVVFGYDDIYLFLNTPNGIESHVIMTNIPYNLTTEFLVEDLNNDGKKDIVAGTWWSKQLNSSLNFSQPLNYYNDYHGGFGFLVIDDINGDSINELFYSADYDVLASVELLLHEGSYIEGYVAIDQEEDCLLDPAVDSVGLYGLTVGLSANDTTYFASTNLNGYYAAFLPDAGNYIATVNLPNNYFTACYNDTLLVGVNPLQETFLDFPIFIEHSCPLMRVNLSTGNFRTCIDGFISVSYCNEGTIPAENATLEILVDSLLVFNTASEPYTTTDSSYIFEIGTVDVFECGQISLQVTPDCDNSNVGDIVCATAYVTPDSLCAQLDSLWDGSNIEVNGFCENDTVHFEIKNTGLGGMSEPRQIRAHIANDDIILIILADTFQLTVNEVKYLKIPANMESLLLEADQDEHHPLIETASTLVTGCADFDLPFNVFPIQDGNPFTASVCTEITGSYDPNDKTAIPSGYGANRLIDRDWEIAYNIRFQNTGNDTAFTVVVLDTIPEYLDLSTLRIGAASHDFVWSLNPSRELNYTFNNILLPDSTTNLVESNGFFQFFIKPHEDIPYGSTIENQAAIYFDFNDPIYTNTTFQTIRTPIFATSEHIDVCEGDEYEEMVITENTTFIDSTLTLDGLFLDFTYIDVIPTYQDTTQLEIAIGSIFNGIEINQDTAITMVLTSSSGCDSIVVYNISVQLSTDNWLENSIELYPQPTDNLLYLSWNYNQINPSQFTILSSDGKRVQQIEIENQHLSTFELRLDDLPTGVYWLQIHLADSTIHKKIIKL